MSVMGDEMPINPEIRASDGDRDRVAASLREHCAQGRLTVEELNERLDVVYAAKTVGDLRGVTADLPEEDMYELPVPAGQRATPAARGGRVPVRAGMRAGWGIWAAASLVNFLIWVFVVVGNMHWVYPWWIWVAGPLGAVLLAGSILGPRDRRR